MGAAGLFCQPFLSSVKKSLWTSVDYYRDKAKKNLVVNQLPYKSQRAAMPAQEGSWEVRPLDKVTQGRSNTRQTQLHEKRKWDKEEMIEKGYKIKKNRKRSQNKKKKWKKKEMKEKRIKEKRIKEKVNERKKNKRKRKWKKKE